MALLREGILNRPVDIRTLIHPHTVTNKEGSPSALRKRVIRVDKERRNAMREDPTVNIARTMA
jgi:hypothetical protein